MAAEVDMGDEKSQGIRRRWKATARLITP